MREYSTCPNRQNLLFPFNHCSYADNQEIPREKVLLIPVINEEKCIGCGACENLCPSNPISAIYVEGHEVHKEI